MIFGVGEVYMLLRKLKPKDASLMLEWMHDDSVVHDMGKEFSKKTLNDCRTFISSSETDFPCIHRAIVDETDKYMGTVSLKYAMKAIIQYAFDRLALDRVYWCVSPIIKE